MHLNQLSAFAIPVINADDPKRDADGKTKVRVQLYLKGIGTRGQVTLISSTKVPGFLNQIGNQTFSLSMIRNGVSQALQFYT